MSFTQVVLALHWLYQQPRAEYINVQQLLQGAGGATAGGAAGGALGFGAGPRAGGRGGGLNTPEVGACVRHPLSQHALVPPRPPPPVASCGEAVVSGGRRLP